MLSYQSFSYISHLPFLGLDIVYPVMGEDFALNCSYSANPSVSAGVIWYKNGNPVDFQTTPHTNITQDGSVMQIIKCEWSVEVERMKQSFF